MKSLIILSAVFICGCVTRPSGSLVELPAVSRSAEHVELPVTMRLGKIQISATVEAGGLRHTRPFVFDTGSPTIISKKLAAQLGLKTLPGAANTGRDAHGQAVTMTKFIVPAITLEGAEGKVMFRKVPALVFDFDRVPLSRCLFDGGVLGSDLLPGSAWRLRSGSEGKAITVEVAESVRALRGFAPSATIPVFAGGYPFGPIVDYRVGAVKDKALFDTGFGGKVALFDRVVRDTSVATHMTDIRKGHGSAGVSAGGRAPNRPLTQFTLRNFLLPAVPPSKRSHNLAPISATTRVAPPTLLGLGILSHHDVTLDYAHAKGARLHLQDRPNPVADTQPAGFAISVVGAGMEVTQLYENAAAARAGLRLGDKVSRLEVAGKELSAPIRDEDACRAMVQLHALFDSAASLASEWQITVRRAGRPLVVRFVPASG